MTPIFLQSRGSSAKSGHGVYLRNNLRSPLLNVGAGDTMVVFADAFACDYHGHALVPRLADEAWWGITASRS